MMVVSLPLLPVEQDLGESTGLRVVALGVFGLGLMQVEVFLAIDPCRIIEPGVGVQGT
jgi:hypothetical protein